jgi:hypothetical protein
MSSINGRVKSPYRVDENIALTRHELSPEHTGSPVIVAPYKTWRVQVKEYK